MFILSLAFVESKIWFYSSRGLQCLDFLRIPHRRGSVCRSIPYLQLSSYTTGRKTFIWVVRLITKTTLLIPSVSMHMVTQFNSLVLSIPYSSEALHNYRRSTSSAKWYLTERERVYIMQYVNYREFSSCSVQRFYCYSINIIS